MTEKDEFCENVRKYERAMYGLAFSIVKNEADAVDVVSESIIRAYTAYSGLRSRMAFKTWILRIVHNTAVELIRRNSRYVLADPADETADDFAENLTARMTVREAVSRMKQPYRTVTELFYFEEMSVLQIAGITRTSPLTVRKQLSRARKTLQETLKEDFSL